MHMNSRGFSGRLGIFLVCLAFFQCGLYTAMAIGGASLGWLLYFDPRIGWSLLESVVRQLDTLPGFSSWVTAVVAAVVGAALIRKPAKIKLYLVAEAVLALPGLAMFIMVVCRNMGPAHGFSIGELSVPGPIFVFVSLIPFTIAYRLRKVY
jgi:hypothetical protein